MSDYAEEYYDWEYPEDWDYPVDEATPGYDSGGCPPLMYLPPLAALLVSLVLVLGFRNITSTAAATQVDAQPATAEEDVSPAPLEIEWKNSGLAPLFSPEVQFWAPDILEWAEAWHIDPNLIASMMQIESCGDPQATSSAGAMGLFQVMPFHFAEGEDGYDPQTNARRGLAYLQRALETLGGEVRLGFAGYNAGINGAQRPEESWPAETIRYVDWGMGIYADAQEGKSSSAHLDEWLASGGARLCAQANERLGLNP